MSYENTDLELAKLIEQMKVANHRIDDLESTMNRIESLTISVEKLAVSVEALAKCQMDDRKRSDNLAERLLEVEQYPIKDKAAKHDAAVKQLVTFVIGAILAYLWGKLTLNW